MCILKPSKICICVFLLPHLWVSLKLCVCIGILDPVYLACLGRPRIQHPGYARHGVCLRFSVRHCRVQSACVQWHNRSCGALTTEQVPSPGHCRRAGSAPSRCPAPVIMTGDKDLVASVIRGETMQTTACAAADTNQHSLSIFRAALSSTPELYSATCSDTRYY